MPCQALGGGVANGSVAPGVWSWWRWCIRRECRPLGMVAVVVVVVVVVVGCAVWSTGCRC